MATVAITNGSFETGTGKSPTGWTGTGFGRVDRTTGQAAEGTGYYALGADSANHGGVIQQTITTEPGKTYTVTFKSGVSWQASNGDYDARIKVEALSGTTSIAVQNVDLPANNSAGWSTYTLTFTATTTRTTLKFTDTSPNGQADFDVGLDTVSVSEPPPAPADVAGQWDPLKPWPLVGIHAVITQDGKLLTFGTDINGKQGSLMYHDLYDPVTGEHHTINHQTHTPTDIFCSAAIIIPGSNEILIAGGDNVSTGAHRGVNDTNFFNTATHQITPSPTGEMNYDRWYGTTVSLASGQIVVFGGLNAGGTTGSTTPEIFTPGEGWRALPGANDPVLGPNYGYPRAWVSGSGEIIYFASGDAISKTASTVTLMALDPSGDGSLRNLGTLPFVTDTIWPAIMYEAGKVLIMASNGDLWTMDINGQTPVYTKVGTTGTDRNYSNMTVLADGTVLINGGTTTKNLEAGSVKTVAIWNPETGTITQGPAEADARQYHSTSIMLTDGSVMSLGGGAGGGAEQTYLTSQIYKPPYLFDENGNPADRPVITAAPSSVEPGDTFTITVDDAASITRLTFSKTGATTHTFNMEARFTELEFVRGPGNTLIVKVPENANDVTAGSWMLFAWNDKGVPSIAPIIAVQPTLPAFDGIGDVTAEYFAINATAMTLDQVNLDAPAIHTERVTTISESGTAAWYTGGPADDFGIRFNGDFNVSEAGTYTFYLSADNGARLKIDGQLVTQTSGTANLQNLTQSITLTAGKHTIELVYIETGGSGQVDLDWAGPGFARKQMTFDGAEHNLLLNGSFDKAGVPTAGYLTTTNGQLAGWTSSNNRIDVWKDGYDSINSPDGTTFVEVDGSAKDISQTVKTVSGQAYDLAFDFAPRGTNFASSKMEVVWNGVVVATIAPTTTGWKTYDFTVVGTGGNDTLTFRTIAGDTDGIGGLLDGVVLKPSDGSAPVDPNPPHPVENLIVNGSFDKAGVPTAGYLTTTNGQLSGWTSSLNRIDVWGNGYSGISSSHGTTFVEVDGSAKDISQTVKTVSGQTYDLAFDFAPRGTNFASSKMEVVWNGVVVATIAPTTTGWKTYDFTVVGTGGNDKLTFRTIAGDTDGIGGLLDGVVLKPAAPVDPNPPHHVENLIVNGSFDKAGVPTAGYLTTTNGQLAGWTSSLNRIDVWGNGYSGISSSHGTTFVEVDGSAKDISQTVKTVSGQAYDLAFDFAPRGTNFASSKMEVVWNGVVVATIAPTTTGWKTYDFTVVGTGGNDKLTFRTIAGDTDGIGGLLDGVVLKPAAPVDPGNMAVNGSFETGAGEMTMPMAHVMGNGQVPGWTSSANRIEIWMNGYNGVTGTDGKNVVEVDAQNGVLSQTIATEAGKAYGITFDYAGQAGAIASSAVEVLWNGVVISTINPADAAFKTYHTHAVGTGGNDVLAFRAVAGDTDSVGGLLDKVVVSVSDHPVASPVTPATERIVNGDFEREDDAAGLGTSPTGWTATGDGGLDTDPGFAPAGRGYYALGGWSNAVDSTLQQMVATVAGQTYTLTFTSGIAYLDGAIPEGVKLQIDALDGATVLQTMTLSFDPIVGFATYSITFVATGTSSTIRFKDVSAAGQGNFDIGIDNVSVKAGGTATPEPVSHTDANMPANTISGTAGNDELFDTGADDTINAGDGNDTIVLGSRGNDKVDGGAGIDVVDFLGNASDYVFTSNADGTITVSNATYGTDTLQNIETLWFAGEAKAYDVAELAPPPTAPPADHHEHDAMAHNTVMPDAHAHA